MPTELYPNVTNPMQKRSFAKKLTSIVAATLDAAKGFETMLKSDAEKLVNADATLVVVNPGTIKGEGDKATIAIKATAAGIAAVQDAPAIVETPKAPVVAGNFVIESGIPIPEIRRGGDRTSQYPFDKLEVGQSFFVPATETMPNPGKTLGVTVSSATRRFKTATPPRVFTIRDKEKATVNGVEVIGARIWRVEPATATPAQTSGDNPAASA